MTPLHPAPPLPVFDRRLLSAVERIVPAAERYPLLNRLLPEKN